MQFQFKTITPGAQNHQHTLEFLSKKFNRMW